MSIEEGSMSGSWLTKAGVPVMGLILLAVVTGGRRGQADTKALEVAAVVHDGDSLRTAIRHAEPGERIPVSPGVYDGPLVIDRDVTIAGEGDPSRIIVETEG